MILNSAEGIHAIALHEKGKFPCNQSEMDD